MDTPLQIIDTQQKLTELTILLEKENIIAADLEADAMYHFQEKVCLIQVATKTNTYVIDPLVVTNLSALKPVFSSPEIKKVFHGSDFDVRSLYRDFKIPIHNLFDTQVACRFLGMAESSLESIIFDRFNVQLNKKFQKKDWSQRPLPKEMVAYAAEDVHYLIPLCEMLEKELEEKDRLNWALDECRLISRVRHAENNEDPLFVKFKGAGKLYPPDLAVLEALLQLRVKIAKKKDRPLFKVFSNNALLKIARAKPRSLMNLDNLNVLGNRQVDMYGNVIIKTVLRAIDTPKDKLPAYPRKLRPALPPGVSKRITALKEWRDKKAAEFEIDPTIIMNKAQMTAVAMTHPHTIKDVDRIEELKRWQRKQFGKGILRALRS
ncbi:MAG: HRDC domain-containing protein [Desulfobacterales bacterium]|nr:HRDC domain-containing protein [Desulfobacterales bacterium]